ncbi:MAG TPA: DUF4255 domain-containing protein [Candidatus Dormibacteraeota bacterium]
MDESLRALVKRDALNGSKADVAFDAPNKEWSSRRNTPTVDLYLYDIREDVEQREVMWQDVRNQDGMIVERRPPPRRFKLSYLVTAWTQRPEDEHRLLSGLLTCFLRNQVMPGDVLSGSLLQNTQPITLSIALPPPQDRSISDVWSALGGELKPSLDLVVNAPIEVRLTQAAGPPVLEDPRFTISRPDAESETLTNPALRAAKGRRAAEARIAAAKPIGPAGPEASRRSGRLKPGEPVQPSTPASLEESIRSGKENQPGRIVKIRGIERS